MGISLTIKPAAFQRVRADVRVQTKGAELLLLRQVNDFLSMHQTRNKSGAFLLTEFVLTRRRGNDVFTADGVAMRFLLEGGANP
jgi:hypothetical protein